MRFVIAKKNCEYLDTPVFFAGADGTEEAVAVFTSRDLAQKYIAEANWSDEQEVGELQPIQFVRWLITAHEQGTDMLVVDPDRSGHLDGNRQQVISLDDPLKTFAELIGDQIDSLVAAGKAD